MPVERALDRLVTPLRVGLARRGGPRPGTFLRQSIPIRGSWTKEGPGWQVTDTVTLCGGVPGDRDLWMLEAVDISTDWTEQRVLENRRQGNRTVRVYGPPLTLQARVLAAPEVLATKK